MVVQNLFENTFTDILLALFFRQDQPHKPVRHRVAKMRRCRLSLVLSGSIEATWTQIDPLLRVPFVLYWHHVSVFIDLDYVNCSWICSGILRLRAQLHRYMIQENSSGACWQVVHFYFKGPGRGMNMVGSPDLLGKGSATLDCFANAMVLFTSVSRM